VAGSNGKRNWLQRVEIGVISIASVLLLPYVTFGFMVPGVRAKALGGFIGIAGLWLVTVPAVSAQRRHWKLRLTSTLFTIPGFLVSFPFLRFQFRTGQGFADILIITILPIAIALHRLYLGWKPRLEDRA